MSGVRIRDKATGDIVTVDAKAAQTAVLRGQAELADRTVNLVGEGGAATVDAREFVQAYDAGYKLADAEEARAAKLAQEAHSVTGQAIGTAEALGRGASLGISDWAARKLGADPEAMRARQEAMGGVGTALEVTGAVLPTLATGGAGAAATGVRGAVGTAARYTPAALATRAGTAAGRAVGGGTLRRGAVAAGIEGGISGAGLELSEASLWDRDVTAEDLASGTLLGSALGLGTVGGTHLLGKAVRSTGEASVAGWQRAAKAIGRTGDDVSEATAGALKKRDILLDPKIRKAATQPDAFKREVTDSLSARYQRARKLTDEADDLVRQQPGRLTKADFSGVDHQIAMRQSAETAHVTARKLDEIASAYPEASKSMSRLRKSMREVGEAASPEAAYLSLDEIGGHLEREIASLEKAKTVGAREAAGELRAVSNVVNSSLDDAKVWKGAVESRKQIKMALDGIVGAESTLPAGLQGGKLDTTELLGLARKGEVDAALGARMNALDTLAEQRGLPKSTRAKVDEARKEIAELRKELKAQSRNAEAIELVDKLGRVDENFSMVSQFSGLLGAGAFAGKIAGMAGMGGFGLGSVAVSAMVRPKAMLGTVASLVDFTSKLSRGREAALARFGQKLQGKATKAGAAVAKQGQRITRETAMRIAKKVARLDPMAVAETDSDSMERLSEVAPRTSMQAIGTTVAAVEFLKSKIPTSYQPPYGGKALVDPVAADRFARYVEAVTQPESVWNRLAAGTLTREHVEAIRTVYPHTYRQVQGAVMDQLGRLQKPPPYSTRMTLGTLLDIPADPSLDPAHRATVAAVLQQQQDQLPPPSGGSATVLAGGAASLTKRIETMTPPGSAGELRKDR